MLEVYKADFLSFIDAHENFIILGHIDPDADCICSQMVLARYLEKKGKQTILVNEGPFKRSEIMEFKSLFSEKPSTDWLTGEKRDETAAIVVDCSALNRVGTNTETLKGIPFCVLDHHSAGERFGEVEIIDDQAPSATLIIYEIGKWMGLEPTNEEAQWIFIGFATDTGFFRYLEAGAASWIEKIAEILRYGVSPRFLYDKLNCTKGFGFIGFVELILSRVKGYRENTILTTYEVVKEEHKGQGTTHSDFIYQVLMMVELAEVVVFLKENQSEGKITVSLRSKKKIDVGSFAQYHYGGGGHRYASGFSISSDKKSLKELEEDIVKRLEEEWS